MLMGYLGGYLEPFVRLIPAAAPDGLGGTEVTWTEGETLQLAVVPLEPREERQGEQPGLSRRVRLLVPGVTALRLEDRVRRGKDGTCFRVTGDSELRHTPARARVAYGICEAEAVEA